MIAAPSIIETTPQKLATSQEAKRAAMARGHMANSCYTHHTSIGMPHLLLLDTHRPQLCRTHASSLLDASTARSRQACDMRRCHVPGHTPHEAPHVITQDTKDDTTRGRHSSRPAPPSSAGSATEELHLGATLKTHKHTSRQKEHTPSLLNTSSPPPQRPCTCRPQTAAWTCRNGSCCECTPHQEQRHNHRYRACETSIQLLRAKQLRTCSGVC